MAEVVPSAAVTRVRERVGRRRRTRETISFAELVLAHYLRQVEIFQNRQLDGAWEQPYRERLKRFEDEYGRIESAYWCTSDPSAAAVTRKIVRTGLRGLWRKEPIARLHSETDWITRDTPEIANELHQCGTLALRIEEVLRGTSELVALKWVLAAMSRLLGGVDQAEERPLSKELTSQLCAASQEDLREIHRYYAKAGENQARLVYFQGMMAGAGLLALLVGAVTLGLYLADFSHWHSPVTQSLLIAVAMGAVGAIISVGSRMAGRGAFYVDPEIGRKTVRHLGSFRPFIGATFAVALYFVLRSDLLQQGEHVHRTIYFFATVSFLAGFSERWAKVMLGRATGEEEAKPEPCRDQGSTEKST